MCSLRRAWQNASLLASVLPLHQQPQCASAAVLSSAHVPDCPMTVSTHCLQVLATLGSVEGLKVLELGAGIGRFTGELARHGECQRGRVCSWTAA